MFWFCNKESIWLSAAYIDLNQEKYRRRVLNCYKVIRGPTNLVCGSANALTPFAEKTLGGLVLATRQSLGSGNDWSRNLGAAHGHNTGIAGYDDR
jgi:hypothetical protein